MKITVKQLESILFDGECTVDGVNLTLEESGEWVIEHKSESCEVIFTDGTKFYKGYVRRSGSYFRGYDLDSELYGDNHTADIFEVEKKVVSVEKWVLV